MASLIDKLTAQGGGESVAFLNDIVKQLWPHISVAGSKILKETAEPMFKTMLPGPLATLHFTKIDFGDVPIQLSNVLATKTAEGSIKLDLNVDWAGDCDIKLDGHMIPTLGVKGVALNGRLSILLGPLSDVIPLMEAAQIAFINPPVLKLDFTGAAAIADFEAIDGAVRGVIMSIINSILVLPNRLMVQLDTTSDYFKTQMYPLGIIRLIVEKAVGFAEDKQSATQKLLSKLTHDSPDAYSKVAVGAEVTWRTSTKNNTTTPVWNEVHDFIVTDFDQCITIDLLDQNVGVDRHIGLAVTTIKEILGASGKQDLSLVHKDVHKAQPLQGKISMSAQLYRLTTESSSFSASDHSAEGLLCGVAFVLIARVFDIPGDRKQLEPSVAVTWGEKHHFQTAIMTDAPGTDICNPTFNQSFRIPITADMIGSGAENFRFALLNKKDEKGSVDVPFSDVLNAPNMIHQSNFAVGGGTTVRASIRLRGIKAATVEELNLS